MYKVVINVCYGGFGLSKEASEILRSQGVDIDPCYGYLPDDGLRHDKRLVEVVEMLGEKANSKFSKLKIVEINSPIYRIDEYDGMESVDTPSSLDWIVIED